MAHNVSAVTDVWAGI